MNQNNSRENWDRSRLVYLHEHDKWTVSEVAKFINKIVATHHQELQKARHDWLQEEIVKLENEKYDEPRGYRGKAFNEAMQTIIDRYLSELDQPN